LWTPTSCEHLQVVNTYKLWTHKSYERNFCLYFRNGNIPDVSFMLTVKYRQYDKRPWCRQYYFTVTVGEGDTKQTGLLLCSNNQHSQSLKVYHLFVFKLLSVMFPFLKYKQKFLLSIHVYLLVKINPVYIWTSLLLKP
jgi:hypothetical protein